MSATSIVSSMLKFLPALALAAALTPMSANARGNQFLNQNLAHQYLVSIPNAEHVSRLSLGRAGEHKAPVGHQILMDSPSQYASVGAPRNN
jgi:hypothetical protein